MEQEIKNKIEKYLEITGKFHTDFLERQTAFAGTIMDSHMSNARVISQARSFSEAFKIVSERAQELRSKYESHAKENVEAFQNMQKQIRDLIAPGKKQKKA